MKNKFYTKITLLLISVLTFTSCDSKSEIAIKEYGDKVGIDGVKSDTYKYGDIVLDSLHTVADSTRIISNNIKESIEVTFSWETDSVFNNSSKMDYLTHFENSINNLYIKWDSLKTYHEKDLRTFDELTSSSFGRNLMIIKYSNYDLSSERRKKKNKIKIYKKDLKLTASVLNQSAIAKSQLQRFDSLDSKSTLVEFYTVPVTGLGVYRYSLIESYGIYQVSETKKVI